MANWLAPLLANPRLRYLVMGSPRLSSVPFFTVASMIVFACRSLTRGRGQPMGTEKQNLLSIGVAVGALAGLAG